MLRLIIFDLDGTIVDSSIDITNAINYAIKPLGMKPVQPSDTIKIVGEGITRLIEKLLPEELSEDRAETTKRFIDYYSAHLLDFTRAYPHVEEVLKALNDYKRAVISNKREGLSISILDGLGLLRYFDLILGSDSAGAKKPSPIPVQRVMDCLGARAEETIIVGDSNLDIEAGKAAHIRTIAVTYGYRPRDVLMDADFMIDDMVDLIKVVKLLQNG